MDAYRLSWVCTNKFWIGGLIGVHLSSIVKWGYQNNFKPVCLFFLRKELHAQEAPKCKINVFHPLRSFCARKLLPLLFSVFPFLFCWLVLVWFTFLYIQDFFAKKIIKWLEIAMTKSLTILHTRVNNNLKYQSIKCIEEE